ncbi:hypothetical protein F2Q68_00024823 [Brassica cretica]|uniref:Uncharacterized protein n=1 Tax=Brassica cretica TaxID=69181 RepID=A0A8S9I7G8_BRACR|nr:hypothetical protein F2Q68_00024823 [Brassica cretica]
MKMERVAETYKAKFVDDLFLFREFMSNDVLVFWQDTRVSSSLKLPWYTMKKGSGSFREHIRLPFGGILGCRFRRHWLVTKGRISLYM